MHQNSRGAPLCLQSWQSPLLVWSSTGVKQYGFPGLQKSWVEELLVYTDAHVQTQSYSTNREILHHHLSETPEQIPKRPCLIYCPGRHLGVKTLPRRIDGSRRPRQLVNSRIKEGKTIVLQSRFPQPVENSAVILALRFRIQRDCVRSYLNSFRTGEIAVGFGFH